MRDDVLLVPVDGSYTLGVDGMVEVIGQIKPKVVIPMHIFGPTTLELRQKLVSIQRGEIADRHGWITKI